MYLSSSPDNGQPLILLPIFPPFLAPILSPDTYTVEGGQVT